MATNTEDAVVEVCAECLTASCWHGEFMCDVSRLAGTTHMLRSRLLELDLEHPDNFSDEKLLAVCGEVVRPEVDHG